MTETPSGLGALFTRTAERRGDATAVVFRNDRRSFARVEAEANRFARALEARGVGRGDLVAIVLGNCIEFVELAIACWKIGAVAFPLSHRLPAREFTELADLAKPVLVVGPDHVSLADLLAEAARCEAGALLNVPSSPWKAIGTGGSTGRPKLIVDHGGRPMDVELAAQIFGMDEGMVQLISGPLYFNGPFAWGMVHLLVGGTLVILERFDPRVYVEKLKTESIGWSFVVPTMLHRIVQLPAGLLDASAFPALRVVLHGGSACPAWLKRRAIEIFGAERVVECYASTEVGGTLIRGDEWLAHPGSVGRPFPPVEIRILDESGKELPPGEIGEVWIKPARRTFAYRGADPRENGDFVSVGDMGWVDADGYLYIADRRTDMIISGGANIYPAEVEGALLEHPAVQDVAVIGLADDEWGRRVHAIIEPVDDVELSTEELERHCRERLAPYKLPRSWEFIPELPRDPSGKIRRAALRAERDAAVR